MAQNGREKSPLRVRSPLRERQGEVVKDAGSKGHGEEAVSPKMRGNHAYLAKRVGSKDEEKALLVEDMPESKGRRVFSPAFISGAAYTMSSCSMILLNKVVLSTFRFDAPNFLMFFQNSIAVLIIGTLRWAGLVQTERLNMKLVRIWLPVNLIFVGMLLSGFKSLQYLQVAMVTILKNSTNILTALGDSYFFGKRHSRAVWGSLLLVILSAVCGGVTDLSFSVWGYTWQCINCCFTASYSLYLRKAMDAAKCATKSGTLNEYTMVILNNLLSLPLIFLLIITSDEIKRVQHSPLLHRPDFWAAAIGSGILGLSISFCSMWFLHQTSPTTYSLVGSLNKIPLSVLGMLMFNAPTTVPNLASIAVGLSAGVLFTRAKMMS